MWRVASGEWCPDLERVERALNKKGYYVHCGKEAFAVKKQVRFHGDGGLYLQGGSMPVEVEAKVVGKEKEKVRRGLI